MSAKKKLGLITSTALICGCQTGSGIYFLPASLSQYGSHTIFMWLTAGIAAMIVAYSFSRLSRIISTSGGPYRYIYHVYNNRCFAFVMGIIYWTSLWSGLGAIAITLVIYLVPVLPWINNYIVPISVLLLIFITCINLFGIVQSGVVQTIFLVCKLIPLAMILIIALSISIYQETTVPFPPLVVTSSENTSIFSTLLYEYAMMWWVFIGLEMCSVPAEKIKNSYTIAKASMLGTFISGVLHLVTAIILMKVVSWPHLSETTTPISLVANTYLGQIGTYIATVGIIFACLGVLNGFIAIQGEMLYAIAKDNMLPKILTYTNRYQVPVVSMILSTVLSILLLLIFGYYHNDIFVEIFNSVASLSILGTLIPYIPCIFAELVHNIKTTNYLKNKKLIIGLTLLSISSGIFVILGIIGLHFSVFLNTALLIIICILVYSVYNNTCFFKKKPCKSNLCI